jgi:electron transport complex protein RnfC
MNVSYSFHGGIHPEEHKNESNTSAIQAAPLPSYLILPVSQHIGASAKPAVSVGQRVLKGELIAHADGPLSAAVHASSSGYIVAIEPQIVAHPSGLSDTCIVIETDGHDEPASATPHPNWQTYETTKLLGLIRDQGIAGLGGAGFPSAYKLNSDAIDTLIINGVECEPYITADDRLMRERSDLLEQGINILQHITGAQKVLIGIEDNKPEATEAVRSACENRDWRIISIPTKYPSGGEKQLIELLTGKQVPRDGIPADLGIVCQNVATAAAIAQAVLHGQPLISRITTLTGDCITRKGNYEVRLGTPVEHLLQHGGYSREQSQKVIMGGPLMGFTLPDLSVPIVKTTNCILAPSKTELASDTQSQPCIRCGHCADVCPASLLPQQLYWYAKSQNHEQLNAHNLADCIECGACAYVCPSALPLVQFYRAAKAEIKEKSIEQRQADIAKTRFEARQARLERDAAEREATRAARKAEAKAKAEQDSRFAGEEDPVQAAIERAKAKKARLQQSAEAGSVSGKIEELKAKLERAKFGLEQAQVSGKEEKVLTALSASVQRLERLLASEQAKQAQTQEGSE